MDRVDQSLATRERFLSAEAEAHQLADALLRLNKELEQYRALNETLDGATNALRQSAAGLQPLLERIGSLLAGLAALGLPELRDGVASQGTQVRLIAQSVEMNAGALRVLQGGQEQVLAQQSRSLETSEFTRQVDGLKADLSQLCEQLGRLEGVGRLEAAAHQRQGRWILSAVICFGLLTLVLQMLQLRR